MMFSTHAHLSPTRATYDELQRGVPMRFSSGQHLFSLANRRRSTRPAVLISVPLKCLDSPYTTLDLPGNSDRQVNHSPFHNSYEFDVAEEEDRFLVTADVPGVKASDIRVSVEEDGQVLRVIGRREVTQSGAVYATRFDKAFALDHNIDANSITASLRDGVLTIAAPKATKPKKPDREILITEGNISTVGEGEDLIHLEIDVPGVKACEMKIVLEEEGHILHLSGVRKVTRNGETLESHFNKSYALENEVDTEGMSAHLADGVITIKAPKRELTDKKIEINPENAPESTTVDNTGNSGVEVVAPTMSEEQTMDDEAEEGVKEEEGKRSS